MLSVFKMQPTGVIVFVILGVVAMTTLCDGARWTSRVPENKAKPRQCRDGATGKYYAIGATWTSAGKCEEESCSGGEPGFMTISGSTCPYPASVPAKCRIVSDMSKDYPGCCPDLVCEDGVKPNVAWVG